MCQPATSSDDAELSLSGPRAWQVLVGGLKSTAARLAASKDHVSSRSVPRIRPMERALPHRDLSSCTMTAQVTNRRLKIASKARTPGPYLRGSPVGATGWRCRPWTRVPHADTVADVDTKPRHVDAAENDTLQQMVLVARPARARTAPRDWSVRPLKSQHIGKRRAVHILRRGPGHGRRCRHRTWVSSTKIRPGRRRRCVLGSAWGVRATPAAHGDASHSGGRAVAGITA